MATNKGYDGFKGVASEDIARDWTNRLNQMHIRPAKLVRPAMKVDE
jgi:hypothetical protein